METSPKRKKCEISLGQLTDKNIKQLKVLNSVVFPVHYGDSFYDHLLRKPELSQLAFYNDLLVGAVSCRFEPVSGSNSYRLYIMTLGVLSPYRKCGIGSVLLNFVIEYSQKSKIPIHELYLHVQENNNTAIEFYKKFGFEITETLENYYKHVTPSSAFVITRKVN